ncbi:MAG: efflux RND transporter permease subunit [Actinomycetaceae bacterium]|nr:efflux RND transporter permease subunit [Actinomycetaceae bacterium]
MLGLTTGDDALQTAQRVRAVAIPQLEKIEGVASVMLVGAPEQQVTIDIDQAKAAQANLADDALAEALDNNGLAVPVGTVASDGHTLDVTVGEKLDSIDDLRALPLETKDGGKPVTLGDIATVELTAKDVSMSARVNGKDAVALIVTPTSSANIVATSQKVRDALDDIQPMIGEDAEFSVIFDQAPYITLSIESLTKEGAIGLLMAVVVILLFLLSVRSTLVTAISIPLSLLLAFIGMKVSGYTLNVLTMSALTITIGRVVDDSIVVIENIKRHVEYGGPKRRAIITAVREVASAVTASTIVTLLVYVPVAFVSGMVGQLFKPFALTVVLAMVASLLVSLTIVPVLAYWFVKPSKKAAEQAELSDGNEKESENEGEEKDVASISEAEDTWLHKAYRPALRGTQKHPVLTLVAALLVLVITGALYPLLNINLMSGTSQNFVSLSQSAPAGTDYETLVAHAEVGEKALIDVAGVDTVTTTVGGTAMMGTGASISYFVTVDEGADQEVLADKLEKVLKKNASGDEVASAGMSMLVSSTIDVDIVASDDQTLEEANAALMAKLEQVEGAKSVTSNLQAEQPSVKITVNREAAGNLGLTENAVVGMISSQMFSASIGQITLDNIDTEIYLKLADPVATLDELKNMKVMGMPLSSIATVEEVTVVPTVTTVNGQRTATISVEPSNPDDLGSLSDAVADAVDSVDLPEGAMTTEAGAAEELNDMFTQLGLAMLAAILLIYVTLVWIFKSLGQPLLLLVSIPFALIGSFLALLVTRQPLGIAPMVGLLMLIGIVVTNAVVLIDLINQYRRAGMTMDEAIDLGAQRRVRPIVMTAISTIAAMIPMALGISGQEGFISQPMALTVIGGLFSSTLLTLVLLPVLYRLTQKNWTPPELELARELEK